MNKNNGWISIYDNERPARKEQVLALSYWESFPAPADMFADPDDRSYNVCTYFYPGDQDYSEVEIEGSSRFGLEEVTCDEEGFYQLVPLGYKGPLKWFRIKTIAEYSGGIVCWKHLDYPCLDGQFHTEEK